MLKMEKIFIWHMSAPRWQKAFDKYVVLKNSFKSIHERHLAKGKHKFASRFRLWDN